MNIGCTRTWLDWIQERSDVRFIDYAGLYMKCGTNRRDLTALLAESNLAPGEEGHLPLRQDDGRAYLPAEVFEEMRWDWGPLPAGFTGRQLLDQARRLAWTSAPAG